MAGDAEELGHHHADYLGAVGHVDAGKLLHREDVGEIVHDPAQVVDAVRVRDEGVPGLPLPHLLRATVVEADLGQAVDDLLSVELQDDADDAVGAGMLGPHVEEHEVGALVAALHAPVLGPEAERLLLPVLAVVGKLERTHLRGPGRMLLAERMAFPGERHEDAAQRRMPVEAHAEHVPNLALVPVGRRPQAGGGGQGGVAVGQAHLQAEVLVPPVGEQVVEHGEITVGLAVPLLAETFVDGGKVVQRAEGAVHLGLEELQDRGQTLPGGPQGRKAAPGLLRREGVGAEASLELGHHRGRITHEPHPLPGSRRTGAGSRPCPMLENERTLSIATPG